MTSFEDAPSVFRDSYGEIPNFASNTKKFWTKGFPDAMKSFGNATKRAFTDSWPETSGIITSIVLEGIEEKLRDRALKKAAEKAATAVAEKTGQKLVTKAGVEVAEQAATKTAQKAATQVGAKLAAGAALGPLEAAGLVSMAIDMLDPRAYNSEVERDTFLVMYNTLRDTFSGMNVDMKKQLAKTRFNIDYQQAMINTGLARLDEEGKFQILQKPEDALKPDNIAKLSDEKKAKIELLGKVDTEYDNSSIGRSLRYWKVDEIKPNDITFVIDGKTGTLDKCQYLNILDSENDNNFMLNTKNCPQVYIDAYKRYYINRHQSTQILDEKCSDGFVDLKFLSNFQTCNDIYNKDTPTAAEQKTWTELGCAQMDYYKCIDLSNKMDTLSGSSLTQAQQQWSDMKCAQMDFDNEVPVLKTSTVADDTFGSCMLETGTTNYYKYRSKIVYRPSRNGGKTCANKTEKVSCIPPSKTCTYSDWYYKTDTGEKNTGQWSPCVQSVDCVTLADKQKTTPLTTDEQLKWTKLGCDTKKDGQYYRFQQRDLAQIADMGLCTGALYREEICPKQDCVLDGKWTRLNDKCVQGSLLCERWKFEEKNQIGIYCIEKNCSGMTPNEIDQEKLRRQQYCSNPATPSRYYYYEESGILTPPSNGGKACDPLRETPCDVSDCQVSNWTDWSNCVQSSTDPNLFVRFRTRDITKPASPGGACNVSLYEETSCGGSDCQLSDWTAIEGCYQDDNGNLVRSEYRSVISPPTNGGKACPSDPNAYQRTMPCSEGFHYQTNQSQSKGFLSNFLAYFLPGSHSERFQTTTDSTTSTTSVDPTTSGYRSAVKVNCELDSWQDWSPCALMSGTYQQIRIRSVKTYPQNGGTGCDTLQEYRPCIAKDCEVSDWNESTDCYLDPTTDKYVKMFKRTITAPNQNGGKECPVLTKTEPCAPVDCVQSEWSEFTPCFEMEDPAGGPSTFKQMRYRTLVTAPLNGGQQCGEFVEEKICPAVKAQVSSLGTSDCYLDDLGKAVRKSFKVIDVPAQYGEQNPDYSTLYEVTSCEQRDCQVTEWSVWSDCYQNDDGTYSQYRSREVITGALNGGKGCPVLYETRSCPKIDCQVSEWTNWSSCYLDENKQPKQYRTREITQRNRNGGQQCPELYEVQSCSSTKDCQLGEWTDWTPCAPDGGVYKQVRTRSVTQYPIDGGKSCDTMIEEKMCAPVDCAYTEWSGFSDCTLIDGKFQRVKTRDVSTAPRYGGKECDFNSLAMYEPCVKDCQYSDWTDWSKCYPSDDKDPNSALLQARTRSLLSGNPDCKDFLETRPCSEVKDCKVSDWTDWSKCYLQPTNNDPVRTSTNTSYVRQRIRNITDYPQNNGKQCGELTQVENCEIQNCEMSEWSDWSECLPVVGDDGLEKWKQLRTRNTLKYPTPVVGIPCGETIQYRDCQSTDCKVTEWTEWSSCFADETGKQVKVRFRDIDGEPVNGGKDCPDLYEFQNC